MRNVLARLQPVFGLADAGGGGGGEGGAGGAGGEGGAGGSGGGAWTPPQGFPAEFAGATADEALGKLLGGYQQVNTRMEGLRGELARRPSAPEKAELYTFDPGDKLKPWFGGDLAANPTFSAARQAAHKHGLSQEQFAGFIQDVYSPLVDQGVLAAPFDPAQELSSFTKLTGLDAKGSQDTLVANEAFAKGLTAQLKDVPAEIKNDIDAMLLGMTDTAAGNILLRAISGRLGESGIRVSGEGGNQGQLTMDDLKKLDSDPKIDPRNRDHKDPNQRFDPDLRRRYDEAYARLATNR